MLAALKKKAVQKAVKGGAAPAAVAPTAVGIDDAAVRKQVEYYFSDENWPKDRFLQSKADAAGWVALADLLPFRKLVSLGVKTVAQAAKAMRGSTSVMLSSDGLRLR